MKTLVEIEQIRSEIKRHKDKTVGFVPTMGYLHRGHLSLVEQCKRENDLTVVSIFVNPTQFAPGEDLERYPRDIERDEKLLEDMGVDILFYPTPELMYPPGYLTYVEVEHLGTLLCGKSRQTHFRGVTTVVLKLFNIVAPDNAYFGRKDAQQAVIVKRMARDLNLPLTVKTVPIARDEDGLALSSRNVYLSPAQRKAALHLSKGLAKARRLIDEGLRDANKVEEEIKRELQKSSLVEIEYISVVSLDRLEPFTNGDKAGQIELDNTLAAVAVKVGKTRLIDNFILGEI